MAALSVKEAACHSLAGDRLASASFHLRGLPHVVGGLGLRLQPMQIIGGFLRVAGGGEDRALVVLQNFEP